jgi:hypothetical protein
MRLKLFALGISCFALLWAAQPAAAGVMRDTGKAIGKGSVAVADTTASAAGAAAEGVATVGKETPGVVKSGAEGLGKGAVEVCKGAAAGPRVGYHGATAGVKTWWSA